MTIINGKDLAIERHGDGETLIMVHGLGGTSNVWGPQVDLLQRYFCVVRPDLEGAGRSACTGRLTIDGFVDDLLGILDWLNVESAHFLGHSMGTIVCQHIAAGHPSRVTTLALLGPVYEPPDAARDAVKTRAAKARAEGMVEIGDAIVQGSTSQQTKAHRPEVASFVRELLMRQDPEGYARMCEALGDAQGADLSAIRCPTLLVTGDEDAVAPPAAAKKIAGGIANSKLRILSRCGHWTPLEKADEVNQLLLDFYLC